jgi:hypothetical protein
MMRLALFSKRRPAGAGPGGGGFRGSPLCSLKENAADHLFRRVDFARKGRS